jgi:hypothetical protein
VALWATSLTRSAHNGASQFAKQIARRPCATNSKNFDFVNLTVNRTEVATKVARFCFVNAAIFPAAQFAYAVTSEL